MTTGYKSGGTDLSSIFYALSGSPASSTGFKVNGTDLNGYFHPYTNGTKATATGYESGSTDLADIFQKIGVTPESVVWTTSASATSIADPMIKAGFRWNTDGSTTRWTTAGQVGGTDWGAPSPGLTASHFQIRMTGFSGDTLDTNTIPTSWTAIGAAYEMSYAAGASANKNCTATVSVRYGTDDSTTVSCSLSINKELNI